jgi:hypothetical protein
MDAAVVEGSDLLSGLRRRLQFWEKSMTLQSQALDGKTAVKWNAERAKRASCVGFDRNERLCKRRQGEVEQNIDVMVL